MAASLLGAAPSARALPYVPAAIPVAPLNGEGYAPLTPARLMDTRADADTIDGLGSGGGAFGPGTTRTLQVTGRGGVPASGVEAVVLHITAVTPTAQTYVTVWPQGVSRPATSSFNPLAGAITSNLAISGVGPSGEVSIFNFTGSSDLIVDVVGWIPPGPTFESIVPHRVLDTRDVGRRVGPGAAIQIDLGSVPGFSGADVSAVALNVTATEATTPTYLTVYPKGVPRPVTSNLNIVPGRDVANMVVAEVGDDGRVTVFNFSGSVHVVVDVLGWFSDGPGYTPIPAVRALDTRESSPVGSGSTITLDLAGRIGLPPAGLGAVVLNLTAVNATHNTFLTVFPDGSPLPNTSDLNPTPGSVIPNLVIAKVGPSGAINIYNLTGTIDVVVDIVGWLPSNVQAADDTATVAEDDPATAITVLSNDSDHDGGPVLIQSVTQPTNGTVVITGGGTGLTYEPAENYCNTPPGTTPDTFSYSVYGAASADVEITVTCVDDAPVAVTDSATVAEDAGATTVDVLANDTDIDGGPISIDSVTQPTNGTVVITGGGTELTYQPDPNYCNTPPGTTLDTFTYTLNGGDTATVSMTVTCVDDNPTAVNDAATVAEDAGATTVDVVGNDTDIDGGPISIDSVTQPANGTVVITGGGTELTYQPDPDYCNNPPGTTLDTFTYTLTPGGSMATVSVTVACVNDVPSFTKGADESVLEDAGAQTVSGWATGVSAGAANESAQTLTFEVTG
ncbi:MAG: Ig-like domain-containing protein, partial [Actinomycetota bacterium]|nr:Ig-like domain-containing protein [Actinomycetota bacterium]